MKTREQFYIAAVALSIIFAVVLLIGCGGPAGRGIRASRHRNKTNPQLEVTAVELIATGDRLAIEGADQAELIRALEAYERAEELTGRTIDSLISRARTIFFIAEPREDSAAMEWVETGELLSQEIAESAPERVEGPYYEALFIGLKARQKSVPKALLMLPRMASRGRRAMEIDETFDDAGPLRLMGTLLVTAPPWPASVGDIEEGLKLLWRAVELSDYPRNRLLLAQALIDDDETEEGCRELVPLLTGPLNARWAASSERWIAEARALATASGCPTPTGVAETLVPGSG